MKKAITTIFVLAALFTAAHTWLRAEQRSTLPDWYQDPSGAAPFLWE